MSTFVLFSGCPGPSTSPRPVPIRPICTILCEARATSTSSWNGQVFVSERTDPNTANHFTTFRPLRGPRGAAALGVISATSTPDTYAINEAWLEVAGAAEMHRGQATRATRNAPDGLTDSFGSAWNVTSQDASGRWSFVGADSANRGDEADSPETAALTVPQLMPVGDTAPHMFVCGGRRAENGGSRTTWLFESIAARAASGIRAALVPIQDVVNGDRYFIPNRPIAATVLSPAHTGPPTAPTPTLSGPGDQSGNGSVQCAMTQVGDNVATRELHMLAIRNGTLYHSMAWNFGPVTDGDGRVFSRFRKDTVWTDVGQALGQNFGTISSAAIVARPSAINVFFIAESGGRYRLWHTVRFSTGGSWRAPVDVLAQSGDAPNGSVYEFRVSAGTCPKFGATAWNAQSSELLVVLRGGPSSMELLVIRVVTTPQQWTPTVSGVYSPWSSLTGIPDDSLHNPFVPRDVTIAVRPFRDDGTPYP